jgi:hypothetical protein
MANVISRAVKPAEEGKASGANNAVREVGGVFGVAVLASVFSRYGGYESAEAFNDGLVVATWVGAVVVAGGALAALAIPAASARRQPARRRSRPPRSRPEGLGAPSSGPAPRPPSRSGTIGR